jgi:hypothetical protein
VEILILLNNNLLFVLGFTEPGYMIRLVRGVFQRNTNTFHRNISTRKVKMHPENEGTPFLQITSLVSVGLPQSKL